MEREACRPPSFSIDGSSVSAPSVAFAREPRPRFPHAPGLLQRPLHPDPIPSGGHAGSSCGGVALASDLIEPPLRTNRSLLDTADDRGTQDLLLLGLCFFHSRPRSSIVLAVVPLDGAWLVRCITRASECEGRSPWSPWQAPPSSDSAQGPFTLRASLLRLSSLPPELRYSYPKGLKLEVDAKFQHEHQIP